LATGGTNETESITFVPAHSAWNSAASPRVENFLNKVDSLYTPYASAGIISLNKSYAGFD